MSDHKSAPTTIDSEVRLEEAKKLMEWYEERYGEPTILEYLRYYKRGIIGEIHIEAAIAQEANKAYDEGYEAGEKAKPPKLVDAIEFRQEQYGWNDTKMAAMLDLPKSHYSEFRHGKRGLPVNSIRKAYAIGISASVLLADDIDRQLTADKEEGQNE